MKIILINCVYKEGSTGKIVAALSEELRASGHDVITCYGLGENNYDDCSRKICGKAEHKINAVIKRLTGISQGGIYFSNIRIRRIINAFCPDVVHIHSANPSVCNVHKLLLFLANAGIKTIFTIHSEIAHTAGCEQAFECDKWKEGCHDCLVYRKKVGSWFFDRSRLSYQKMYNAINSFDSRNLVITAVSPWLASRAKQSAIMRRYLVVSVPNGVDTSIFYYRGNKGIIDRENFRGVFLFVTPYLTMDESDNKGGYFIMRLASQLTEFKFVVVAGREITENVRIPQNVQLWGRAKSQLELSQLYSEADATLMLSRRETFSMVTAESLCCGTPVIGFKAGGPESIAIEDYCHFVDYSDIPGLLGVIKHLRGEDDKLSISRLAQETYDKKIMANLYYQVYVKQ